MPRIAKPKAVYVGLPEVHAFLERLRPDWEFAEPVPDIDTFWDWYESGRISTDTQVILVLDMFFEESGQDKSFEQFVTSLAPYCLFGIINYKPETREQINERIEKEAYASGVEDPKYYFIDPLKPAPSLDSALSRFIQESNLSEAVSILSGQPIEEVEYNETPEPEVNTPPVNPFAYLEDDDDDEFYGEAPRLGQVVAVTSSKGGSGKSTVALTLATYLAHASENSVRDGLEDRPLKVVVLDLDVRDGQLGFLTGNAKPTVIKLRLEGISKETVENVAIHSPRLKVDILLAPKRPRNSEDTPPDFYVELLHILRKMYDYVILDTSVNYLDPLLEKVAYPTADQIIFVTDIVINSVFSMTRWIQEVTKPKNQMGMGVSKNKIGIVVNKSLNNVNMPGSKIARSSLGIAVITAIPSNPKIMAHAANIQSMEVLLKHKDIYTAIRRLAKAVTGRKYKLSDNVD